MDQTFRRPARRLIQDVPQVPTPSEGLLSIPSEARVVRVAPSGESIIEVIKDSKDTRWEQFRNSNLLFPEHVPQSGPLFVGTPELKDIGQRQLGDCWFLAALAAIVHAASGSFFQLIMCGGRNDVYVRLYDEVAESGLRRGEPEPDRGARRGFVPLRGRAVGGDAGEGHDGLRRQGTLRSAGRCLRAPEVGTFAHRVPGLARGRGHDRPARAPRADDGPGRGRREPAHGPPAGPREHPAPAPADALRERRQAGRAPAVLRQRLERVGRRDAAQHALDDGLQRPHRGGRGLPPGGLRAVHAHLCRKVRARADVGVAAAPARLADVAPETGQRLPGGARLAHCAVGRHAGLRLGAPAAGLLRTAGDGAVHPRAGGPL